MRAVIIDTPGTIRVGSVPDPTPGPEELVIKVGACGICGTDLHIADGEFPPTPYPIIPGHEFAGEVVAVGTRVPEMMGETFTIGTRVAVDPSLFCGHCAFCHVGKGNLCENWNAIGDTVNGAFAEYVAVPAANAYPIPERVSYREAALIEPVSCAVHGIHRLQPSLGDSMLIVGAGTMGLLLLQLALRGGASRVAVLDLNTERLALAKRLGAYQTANNLIDILALEPSGFDCVIDATGVPPAIESALQAVKRGGKFMIFGVAPSEARVALSPFRIYNDEITIVGSMAVLHSYQQAVDLVSRGAIDTSVMLTEAFPLEDFSKALDRVRRGEGLKTQILPNGEL
ncbi:NADPH2:quinone reductase [Thermosporothrix hazakensis]|jgi:NADPH2:quinone reductase|uniref:NADPH2:quinone reductase n=2 Tax=Thermosporothrix TaxID=768650 RepID=A0A326U496_THEHA|nr:zinc-dependent alcohol dehydrogenase family protein [Thermosporothrix hazakensis]PZW24032.1 NADPH2:quinone reductase [Thermosporothrix hazakensis]BBH87820.1 alcohol dehydrogenase [Thermosporothrix sp. COM3]GCE50248.1 alcohol dehydrogenase [Thermosporothrix hazakensis]